MDMLENALINSAKKAIIAQKVFLEQEKANQNELKLCMSKGEIYSEIHTLLNSNKILDNRSDPVPASFYETTLANGRKIRDYASGIVWDAVTERFLFHPNFSTGASLNYTIPVFEQELEYCRRSIIHARCAFLNCLTYIIDDFLEQTSLKNEAKRSLPEEKQSLKNLVRYSLRHAKGKFLKQMDTLFDLRNDYIHRDGKGRNGKWRGGEVYFSDQRVKQMTGATIETLAAIFKETHPGGGNVIAMSRLLYQFAQKEHFALLEGFYRQLVDKEDRLYLDFLITKKDERAL